MAHHEQHDDQHPTVQTATVPNWTMTVDLGRTLKEGWHYESKVTASGQVIDRQEFAQKLQMARELGEAERDERNRRDAARNEGLS